MPAPSPAAQPAPLPQQRDKIGHVPPSAVPAPAPLNFAPPLMEPPPVAPIPGQLVARAWTSHAKTTIGHQLDSRFEPLANLGNFGRHNSDDEAYAAELVRRWNLHQELVVACAGLLAMAESGVTSLGALRAGRAVIAKAGSAA